MRNREFNLKRGAKDHKQVGNPYGILCCCPGKKQKSTVKKRNSVCLCACILDLDSPFCMYSHAELFDML